MTEAYGSVHFLSSIFQGNASFTKSYRTILSFLSKRNDNEYLKLSFFLTECQKDFEKHSAQNVLPAARLEGLEVLQWTASKDCLL